MMIMEPVYLGFDYGTTNIAVGYITEEEGTRIDETFFLKLDPAADPLDIHDQIGDFINNEVFAAMSNKAIQAPWYSFIESTFSGPNKRTYQRMTRVAHSIYIYVGRDGHVQYLDNNVWRKVLFGKGNIKKDKAQEWAFKRWPELQGFPKYSSGHRADSLMIAEAGKRLVESNAIEQKARGPR